MSDPILGHCPAANFKGRMIRQDEFDVGFETNSLGLRDRDYGPKQAKGTRILFVGESFLWGTGVEQDETFVEVLERKFNDSEVEAPYELINAGVGGYGGTATWRFTCYGKSTRFCALGN